MARTATARIPRAVASECNRMRVAWEVRILQTFNGHAIIMVATRTYSEVKELMVTVHRHETRISTTVALEGKLMSRIIRALHELLVQETFNSIVTQSLEGPIYSIMNDL